MINDLTTTLKAILDDASVPDLVRNAIVEFDRPAETYKPGKNTINIFLYDVRENAELRSSEPVVERQNGVATIRKAPLRVACSYMVTAWPDPGLNGDVTLLQHQLLGGVLNVFASVPTIPETFLQGELVNQMYPIPLVAGQGDLVRNPAEFWTAMGGKLRPSITLTATIAMQQSVGEVTAKEVSSRLMTLRQINSGTAETLITIGGTVRDDTSHDVLEGVAVTLLNTDRQTISDANGHFTLAGLVVGSYTIQAVKPGYPAVNKSVQVPGSSPTHFDIDLTFSI